MALNADEARTAAAGADRGAPRFARRAWPVGAAGLAGVAGLLLQPLPPAIARLDPGVADGSPLAVKALLALNPAVLVLAAAGVGAALGHRVGLRSLLAGSAPEASWRRTLAGSALLGVVLGLVLGAADTFWRPHLGAAWQRLVDGQPVGAGWLAGAVLYGGVAEEVMLRWGWMSLVAWALAWLPGPWPRTATMPAAITVAAGLFAAAHLPVLAAQIDLTPGLVLRTLLLNAAAGLVYGWLFWRHHLEAAMAAHAATHLGMAAWRALVP